MLYRSCFPSPSLLPFSFGINNRKRKRKKRAMQCNPGERRRSLYLCVRMRETERTGIMIRDVIFFFLFRFFCSQSDVAISRSFSFGSLHHLFVYSMSLSYRSYTDKQSTARHIHLTTFTHARILRSMTAIGILHATYLSEEADSYPSYTAQQRMKAILAAECT